MLAELRVRDLAIIDNLELSFGPGFNVLTGETGAGKSIIIDAVSLLLGGGSDAPLVRSGAGAGRRAGGGGRRLGGRSDATMVRSGAEAARLEGVFTLDPETREAVQPILEREELQSD